MGKVKENLMGILSHDLCYGKGWLYYGDEDNFDIAPCDCNLYSTPYDEIMDYHQLFTTRENA
jgi:hypothetical protein